MSNPGKHAAYCACGQPLHYKTARARRMVEAMIALSGGDEMITVTVHGRDTDRVYRVQRHYIALHGLKASDLLRGIVPGATEVIGL